ncbi:Glucose-fructose oxidoreductase [Purpureocillium takamizusanense]|uniref:Glucose-fructose oxidoreductase n=1 Tax=Purpureocillium takamizusanense TaxID=2060973 RepID=A0A9Q8Q7Y4_9HYPO|nr:Glucose-fructose oxidoreductase [Purpureocillium takamizusanense]UNI15504.1 Glucose-fructose oxidoreductase [Purpureocillium takamizusanense]
MTSSSPIGVAIIGGGLFVKEQHLPAVLACRGLALRAIYSRSLASAESTAALIPDLVAAAAAGAAGEPQQVDLYAEDAGPGRALADLLSRSDVAAVIIALPILAQPAVVEAALVAGKHVLAEKPIAKDVASAQALIASYRRHRHQQQQQQQQRQQQHGDGGVQCCTLAIAENFRFVPRFVYAAEQAARMGRVTHFSVKVMSHMRPDNKYYQTTWRQRPGYQGGFLLDGGVHHAAAARLFLRGGSGSGSGGGGEGKEGNGDNSNRAASVRAVTALVQPGLPPIDTVTAVLRTEGGATGTFQHSAGTLMEAFEWDVACERGWVRSSGETVVVKPSGGERTERVFERTSGVAEEVAAWAEGIARGEPNPLQSPEEALADLEFLEKMFVSGERDGELERYELQL